MANQLVFLRKKGFFEFKTKVWFMFLFGLLRVSLLFVLWIQQSSLDSPETLFLINDIIGEILVVYFFLMFLLIFISFFFFIYQSVRFIRKCVANPTFNSD